MKIFFATDIHGSEICWRKFLNAAAFYKADLVVLGGDVTGKIMVPIVARNGYWEVTIRGERRRLENREALAEAQKQLRDRGSYPAIVTPDELDALDTEQAIDDRFNTEMTQSLDRWLDMADGKLRSGDIPCILNGGNDDIFDIDPILEASPCVTFAEGKVLDLDGWSMVSMGWTNLSRTIFNFHAPPFGSGLDEAPALDANMRPTHGGAVMKPVGSTAVREALQRYQPPLSVHGHIHESRGVARVGRTLAINPGSSYSDGVLQAAIIDLNQKKGKVKYVLVNG
jgi:Icc-related predicted phosphoesterase